MCIVQTIIIKTRNKWRSQFFSLSRFSKLTPNRNLLLKLQAAKMIIFISFHVSNFSPQSLYLLYFDLSDKNNVLIVINKNSNKITTYTNIVSVCYLPLSSTHYGKVICTWLLSQVHRYKIR